MLEAILYVMSGIAVGSALMFFWFWPWVQHLRRHLHRVDENNVKLCRRLREKREMADKIKAILDDGALANVQAEIADLRTCVGALQGLQSTGRHWKDVVLEKNAEQYLQESVGTEKGKNIYEQYAK